MKLQEALRVALEQPYSTNPYKFGVVDRDVRTDLGFLIELTVETGLLLPEPWRVTQKIER